MPDETNTPATTPDPNAQLGAPPPATPPAGQPPAQTWEEIMAAMGEPQRAAYEANVAGLKGALKSERDAAKSAAQKLKDALSSADSEKAAQLTKLQAELDAANSRIAFIGSPDAANLIDVEAGYVVARARNLFDDKGQPKWADLKAAHPALFRAPAAPPSPPDINSGNRPSGGVQTFNGRSLDEVAQSYNIPLPRKAA